MSSRFRPSWPDDARRVAFFDVDETLVAVPTLYAFWHWWRGGADDSAVDVEHRALAESGASREALNRRYFRRYAGTPAERLAAAGRSWYGAFRQGRTAFVAAGLAALEDHLAEGDAVVLVSASMPCILDPIAQDLGVHRLVCTELAADPAGLLTGEVTTQMVGAAKGRGVAEVLAGLAVPADACFAYGDHVSDLPMLQAVGNPVVVGPSDPELAAEATIRGWPVLPAIRGTR